MSSGRSDASTSTDDVQSRPLCLFYFTHPFGVLSPEPPTLVAPAHVARAFLNMQPVAPCSLWGDCFSPAYSAASASASDQAPAPGPAPARPDRGVVPVRPLSLSSSLFSGDVWFDSGSSGRSADHRRRLIPLNKILPPLHLPSPLDSSSLDAPDELWPTKCLIPEKFSLPPIEMPEVQVKVVQSEKCVRSGVKTSDAWSGECPGGGGGGGAARRRGGGAGVRKGRRPADLRRVLAALLRRALAGGCNYGHGGGGSSPALRDALNTIREAWTEPRSLLARCAAERSPRPRVWCEWRAASPAPSPAMLPAAAVAELAGASARANASPGLLRRRYSVPETVMRKYRLAQQGSDSEESAPATCRSASTATAAAAAACPSPEAALRLAQRCARELPRRSALLRRVWGARGDCAGCCCCADETRSLDASRSELRALSALSALSGGAASGRSELAAPGWATPKRQRLHSRDFRGSDEMLRAAMRNSYDRAEETRDQSARASLSVSTYRSHADRAAVTTDAFTDSDISKYDDYRPGTPGGDVYTKYPEPPSSEATTVGIKSENDTYVPGEPSPTEVVVAPAAIDERSLSDSSETFSVSLCTAKETLATQPFELINTRISKHSEYTQDVGHKLLPYHEPLTIETTPSCEMLEIVVSETLNSNAVPSALSPTNNRLRPNIIRVPSQRSTQNINIDEYVSNILVESLNSLTDQLEFMSASVGSERKISIVEKEIKVKLQNTGVNTIVHLSPTSNNQIIFGNEELFNDDSRRRDTRNNALTIREEVHSVESNNNVLSHAAPDSSFDIHHDNVNKAVLQQIQKLFRDELNALAPADYPTSMPKISHVETSDVDVFIDNAEAALAEQEEQSSANSDACKYELISGVGTGNYYPNVGSNPVVPRFSALPHTDSMEVNTSSSDDADVMGSECTSLVDSLDDPNSPRSILLRRVYSGRRSELVRSTIDVLELLPENSYNDTPREKPESFFIDIKDNECECDMEKVNVADSMPEKIKQRLYRRHRKRELRMECARRTRSRHQRRDREFGRIRHDDTYRAQRDLQRDCIAIVNALIDDVIAKIAQDEYKCMRIKHRPLKMPAIKSCENVAKRPWRKQQESNEGREPFKAIKNGCVRSDVKERRTIEKTEHHQIFGKLSLRPPLSTDNRTAKRIYQKSEIREGDKCIEILEILEYVNGSQSSPETGNSDENQNPISKNKKSRIPVPIAERSQRSPPNGESQINNNRPYAEVTREVERNEKNNRLIADMLIEALAEPPARRASLPEARERSNSLRFRQVFDIIPEERSSISLDSGAEDLPYNRRSSAPDIVEDYHVEEPSERECDDAPPEHSPLVSAQRIDDYERHKPKKLVGNEIRRKFRETKSVSTSPMSNIDADKRGHSSKHQTTMTSPVCKSAATSPLRSAGRGRARAAGIDAMNTDTDESPPRGPATAHRDPRRPERGPRDERAEPGSGARRERGGQAVRSGRAVAQPARRRTLARSQSIERVTVNAADLEHHTPSTEEHRRRNDSKPIQIHNNRAFLLERNREETIVPDFKSGEGGGSSDSSESGGTLLCPLAPRWLAPGPGARRAGAARRRGPAPEPGAWSVTVAGSCREALPADVEMRLRFPHDRDAPPLRSHPDDRPCQECTCAHCAACSCSARAGRVPPLPPPPAPPPPPPPAPADSRLTLTMKKEALDSSILASKSSRKSSAQLPDVETYRTSRSKLKSSVKARRGYSLHCWLPDTEDAPVRARDELSVLGCAIVPELKPRAPTMSERDLTRVYTPRHYLRL